MINTHYSIILESNHSVSSSGWKELGSESKFNPLYLI